MHDRGEPARQWELLARPRRSIRSVHRGPEDARRHGRDRGRQALRRAPRSATLDFAARSLTGVESGDEVTLVTTGATGTFPGPGVASDLVVTVTHPRARGGRRRQLQPGPGDGDDDGVDHAGRTLTVTAASQTITFGAPDPAFTFAYGTFAGTETAAVIDTPPTCSDDVAGRATCRAARTRSSALAARTTTTPSPYLDGQLDGQQGGPDDRLRHPTAEPGGRGHHLRPGRDGDERAAGDVLHRACGSTDNCSFSAAASCTFLAPGTVPAARRTRPATPTTWSRTLEHAASPGPPRPDGQPGTGSSRMPHGDP